MSQAKTVKETLIAAKWILENVGWCQEHSCEDAKGMRITISEVVFGGTVPAKVCLQGALYLVEAGQPIPNLFGDLQMKAYNLLTEMVANSVPEYNDTHTFQEVIALVDRAIAKA